jgi:hypothetical protein
MAPRFELLLREPANLVHSVHTVLVAGRMRLREEGLPLGVLPSSVKLQETRDSGVTHPNGGKATFGRLS